MRLLKTCLAVGAVLAVTACSDDKDTAIPEELRAVKLELVNAYPFDSPLGVVVLDTKGSSTLFGNFQYKIQSANSKVMALPVDEANKVLLPEDGTVVNVYAYLPHSESMDKEKLIIPLDVSDQAKWKETGFQVAKCVQVASPIDTAVQIKLEHKLCRVQVEILKDGVDIETIKEEYTASITNVAKKGNFSLLTNKFEDVELIDEYTFVNRNEQGMLNDIFLSTDRAVEIIVRDKAGETWKVSEGFDIVTGQPRPMQLDGGQSMIVLVHLYNKDLKSSSIVTYTIQE